MRAVRGRDGRRRHQRNLPPPRDEPILLGFFDTDDYSPARAAFPLCVRQPVVGGSIVFDHVYSLGEYLYTLGERIAAYEMLGESGFFHLHSAGVFTRTR